MYYIVHEAMKSKGPIKSLGNAVYLCVYMCKSVNPVCVCVSVKAWNCFVKLPVKSDVALLNL